MTKGRLEAFSDGVLAIILTIMVLELKIPHKAEISELRPLIPVFFSYLLSFINIAIYWNNHHHMMHAVEKVNGKILWANIHLLFWLSLFPFVTGWMGENNFSQWPVVFYGIVCFMAGIAYFILSKTLLILHGKDSTLATAIGNDSKSKKSVLLFAAGIGLSFLNPWLGIGMYAVVTAMWFIPDKRIEKKIEQEEEENDESPDNK